MKSVMFALRLRSSKIQVSRWYLKYLKGQLSSICQQLFPCRFIYSLPTCMVNDFAASSRKMSSENCDNAGLLVAVCQFTAKSDIKENLNTCKYLIANASSAGAKVVFLPEACDYIAESKADSVKMAEPLTGNLISNYRQLAKTSNVWLSLGGIHEKSSDVDDKVFNSHVLIDNEGEIAAVYRKLHLFDVEIPERNISLKESDYVLKGNELVTPICTPVGKIGLGICYDVRFPEMAVALRNGGADILTYPSAFTFATGALHWEVLLRSRAIETQCYVIAAAQTGFHNAKRQSWGHAVVVDPLGCIIAQCSEGTGFALARINGNSIENVRKSMPIKEHRRTDIYPEIISISSTKISCAITYNESPRANYQFGQVLIPDNCVFYKTKLSMAFVNKRCIVPGHVLIAPLRNALRLADLTTEEVSDLFCSVQKVEAVLELVYGASSTTIAIQDGPEAGRTINHLHIHILPRKPGDFLQNDQIYYELQHHDKNEDKPWRAVEEMDKEASNLRKYFE